MTNLAYLTPDRALSLLTNPPSLEVISDRLNQIEAYLNGWFRFRFPETDYVEEILARSNMLTLRQYPVVSVTQVRCVVPSAPGEARSYSTCSARWVHDRTVWVPSPRVYECSYRAGYGALLSQLEPILIGILSRWDETGGLGWLSEAGGNIVEVSIPGGITQRKQYGSLNNLGNQTEGDRLLASFARYRRLTLT